MALEQYGIQAVVQGVNKYTSDMGRMNKSTSKFGDIIKKVSLIGTAAMAALGLAATKMAIDFEKSMAEVQTLLPQMGTKAFGKLREDVLAFSKDMGIATDKVVPALYQAISAGVPPDNVFTFLRTAVKVSIGGVTELNTAVDGLTSIVNAYGKENITTAEAADIMFTAIRLGKTTADELSSSLFNVIPVAAAVGIGFDQVASALVALTAAGVPTSVATTQLRAAIQALSAPTVRQTKILEEMGLEFSAETLRAKGLQGAMQDLLEATGGNMSMLRRLVGSVEAVNAVLIVADSGAEKYAGSMVAMANKTGAANEAFLTMEETVARKLEKAINNLKVTLTVLGLETLPTITKALNTVTDALENNKRELKAAAVAVGALVAVWVTFKIGVITTSIWGAVAALGALSAGAVSGAGAVGGLTAALWGLRAALITTGIGALVIALATALFLLWKNWSKVEATLTDTGWVKTFSDSQREIQDSMDETKEDMFSINRAMRELQKGAVKTSKVLIHASDITAAAAEVSAMRQHQANLLIMKSMTGVAQSAITAAEQQKIANVAMAANWEKATGRSIDEMDDWVREMGWAVDAIKKEMKEAGQAVKDHSSVVDKEAEQIARNYEQLSSSVENMVGRITSLMTQESPLARVEAFKLASILAKTLRSQFPIAAANADKLAKTVREALMGERTELLTEARTMMSEVADILSGAPRVIVPTPAGAIAEAEAAIEGLRTMLQSLAGALPDNLGAALAGTLDIIISRLQEATPQALAEAVVMTRGIAARLAESAPGLIELVQPLVDRALKSLSVTVDETAKEIQTEVAEIDAAMADAEEAVAEHTIAIGDSFADLLLAITQSLTDATQPVEDFADSVDEYAGRILPQIESLIARFRELAVAALMLPSLGGGASSAATAAGAGASSAAAPSISPPAVAPSAPVAGATSSIEQSITVNVEDRSPAAIANAVRMAGWELGGRLALEGV